MDHVDNARASEALAQAREARALGAGRAARPSWYYPALGVSMWVALASFSVGSSAIGVPLGMVLGPVALEMLVRQRAGAAPLPSYTDPSVRGLVLGYVVAVVALAGIGILLEEVAGMTGAAAVCGAVVLVLTVLVGRRVDRQRVSARAGSSLP